MKNAIVIEGMAGKRTVSLIFYADGSVRALVKNASHRAFKGIGRLFKSTEEAAEGYKSKAVREFIKSAADSVVF